jgi:5'(3')-deoxyribonucleotidase
MKRPILAIDIDDVLSVTAESFIAFSNERWGTNLTLDNYTEHWAEMWQVEYGTQEFADRVVIVNESKIFGQYARKSSAEQVLQKLHTKFRIVAVTSRRKLIATETRAWIGEHFKGVIDEILFAGIYDTDDDSPETVHERLRATKADILSKLQADYFIDDHPKHCVAAASIGVPTIVFGHYPWNKDIKLSKGMTRCADWPEVERYFQEKGLL